MYKARLMLEEEEFLGTLDMYVIKIVSNELNISVNNIFSKIAELDMTVVSAIVIESLRRIDIKSSSRFLDMYSKFDKDSDNIFKIFTFVTDLMDKCMPLTESKEESEFEDIPDDFNNNSDWDFPYMEFLWKSKLLRSEDFWSITPKNFFEQVDCYKKANNIQEDKVEHL